MELRIMSSILLFLPLILAVHSSVPINDEDFARAIKDVRPRPEMPVEAGSGAPLPGAWLVDDEDLTQGSGSGLPPNFKISDDDTELPHDLGTESGPSTNIPDEGQEFVVHSYEDQPRNHQNSRVEVIQQKPDSSILPSGITALLFSLFVFIF